MFHIVTRHILHRITDWNYTRTYKKSFTQSIISSIYPPSNRSKKNLHSGSPYFRDSFILSISAKELVQNVLDGKSEIILGKSRFRSARSASISGLFAWSVGPYDLGLTLNEIFQISGRIIFLNPSISLGHCAWIWLSKMGWLIRLKWTNHWPNSNLP